jgi:hypothetical protein
LAELLLAADELPVEAGAVARVDDGELVTATDGWADVVTVAATEPWLPAAAGLPETDADPAE